MNHYFHHYYPLLTTINHYEPQLTIMIHYEPLLSTIIHQTHQTLVRSRKAQCSLEPKTVRRYVTSAYPRIWGIRSKTVLINIDDIDVEFYMHYDI